MNNIIVRKNLSELVADQLLEKIATGHYKPGQKLPVETELMVLFGVGRSTVREAVKLLANSNHVNVFQGKGTFVAADQRQENMFMTALKNAPTSDVYQILPALEDQIINAVLSHRSMIEPTKLKIALSSLAIALSNLDLIGVTTGHFEFYQILASSAGNKVLSELYIVLIEKAKNEILIPNDRLELLQLLPDYHSGILTNLLSGNQTLTRQFHCQASRAFYKSNQRALQN